MPVMIAKGRPTDMVGPFTCSLYMRVRLLASAVPRALRRCSSAVILARCSDDVVAKRTVSVGKGNASAPMTCRRRSKWPRAFRALGSAASRSDRSTSTHRDGSRARLSSTLLFQTCRRLSPQIARFQQVQRTCRSRQCFRKTGISLSCPTRVA